MGSWIEKSVTDVLNRVLKKFVKGFDAGDTFKLNMWQGSAKLYNLELQTELLSGLNLPVTISGVYVGEVTIDVPWRSLMSKPIEVHVKHVYVLVKPKDGRKHYDSEEEAQQEWKTKQAKLIAWQALEDNTKKSASGTTIVDRIAAFLLRKVTVSVRDVHLRMEAQLETHPNSNTDDDGAQAPLPAVEIGLVLDSMRLNDSDGTDETSKAQQQASKEDKVRWARVQL